MKQLSEEDKKSLAEIVNEFRKDKNTVLSNILSRHLDDKQISIDYKEKKVNVLQVVKEELEDSELAEQMRNIYWLIIRHVNLLKYLEGENYLYIYRLQCL